MEKEKKEYIRDYIIDNSYFKWLEAYMPRHRDVVEFHERLVDDACYKEPYYGLTRYTGKVVHLIAEFLHSKGVKISSNLDYYIRYNNHIYHFFGSSMGYTCTRINENNVWSSDKDSIIDYSEFREFCKKNMKDNFDRMFDDVKYSLENTDLDKIDYELSKMKEPTLVAGVGGSHVVSEYASKVLECKNGIITRNTEPRDFNYMNINPYKNVLVCSYGGLNYGVDVALNNNLNHYLLAARERENVTNLTYAMPHIENSFISLSATLVPCAIMSHYLDKDKNRILDSLKKQDFDFPTTYNAYEIFSGHETSTASEYLESTMLEAGLGVPIVHDKYSYCHGRSTFSVRANNMAIYFNGHTELDKLYLEELPKYYSKVLVLEYRDEFDLLVQCMMLTKHMAEAKLIDLSGVNYSPIVKKLYRYKGEM